MRWQFVLDNAGAQAEVANARTRKVTWRVDDASEAGFVINGRGAHAELIHELATDLLVLIDGTPHYRGRVGATADTVDAEHHDVNVPSADYRALLTRRILYDSDTLAYVAVDECHIAWQLIQQTQARSGGDLGITEGVGPSAGTVRTVTFDAGKPIADSINLISRTVNGFDWEIDATKHLNRWPGGRGADNEVVLDYGGVIDKVQRNVDPTQFFDGLRMTGDQTLTPETRTSADIGTRPEGRWDMQIGETDIVDQAVLAARASYEIEDGPLVLPSYVLTFAPGRWEGPSHVWVGDTVSVRLRSLPRLDVNTTMRVYDISVELDANGQPTVSASVNAPRPNFANRLPQLSRRLEDLERR